MIFDMLLAASCEYWKIQDCYNKPKAWFNPEGMFTAIIMCVLRACLSSKKDQVMGSVTWLAEVWLDVCRQGGSCPDEEAEETHLLSPVKAKYHLLTWWHEVRTGPWHIQMQQTLPGELASTRVTNPVKCASYIHLHIHMHIHIHLRIHIHMQMRRHIYIYIYIHVVTPAICLKDVYACMYM